MARYTMLTDIRRKQRRCAHPELKYWYGGGFRKAQCQYCLERGLADRLEREQRERAVLKEVDGD